jgi:hypothetical protein
VSEKLTHQATDTASAALLEEVGARFGACSWLKHHPDTGVMCAERFKGDYASYCDRCLALASLPAPAAPRGTDRAEDKKPLPPDVLADALQDRIAPTSGRLRGAVAVKRTPAAPEEEKSFSYREGES